MKKNKVVNKLKQLSAMFFAVLVVSVLGVANTTVAHADGILTTNGKWVESTGDQGQKIYNFGAHANGSASPYVTLSSGSYMFSYVYSDNISGHINGNANIYLYCTNNNNNLEIKAHVSDLDSNYGKGSQAIVVNASVNNCYAYATMNSNANWSVTLTSAQGWNSGEQKTKEAVVYGSDGYQTLSSDTRGKGIYGKDGAIIHMYNAGAYTVYFKAEWTTADGVRQSREEKRLAGQDSDWTLPAGATNLHVHADPPGNTVCEKDFGGQDVNITASKDYNGARTVGLRAKGTICGKSLAVTTDAHWDGYLNDISWFVGQGEIRTHNFHIDAGHHTINYIVENNLISTRESYSHDVREQSETQGIVTMYLTCKKEGAQANTRVIGKIDAKDQRLSYKFDVDPDMTTCYISGNDGAKQSPVANWYFNII